MCFLDLVDMDSVLSNSEQDSYTKAKSMKKKDK